MDDIIILVDTRADRPVVIITELGDKNEVDGRVYEMLRRIIAHEGVMRSKAQN